MAANWKFNRPKPVIGIIGGIGSGKSMVSRLLAGEGCGGIDSDAASHEIIETAGVKKALVEWLGREVLRADGTVDRKAVARHVFGDAGGVARLNGMIHPEVARRREEWMAVYMADPAVRAVVWDTPLLVEAGLAQACDAVIFVGVSEEIRQKRVQEKRGWGAQELAKREKLQIPLDKKAAIADYCVDNSGDEAATLSQVQRVLSQLFAL